MKGLKFSLPMMKARNNVSTYGIEREDESLVAIVFNQPNMRVIANMFASAPEMFKELERLSALFSKNAIYLDEREKIEKIIRKARGESEDKND